MTRAICALDTETTGLHSGRQAWEIALVRCEADGTRREESFFVQVDLASADLLGLRIGGFWERHPLGRRLSIGPQSRRVQVKTRRDAAYLVAQLTHDATIVGAVPSFDTEVLERLLRDEGLTPAWHYRLRCVETLTAGHLHHDLGGLQACAEALGIPTDPSQLHTALGDARLALAIWDHLMTPAAVPA